MMNNSKVVLPTKNRDWRKWNDPVINNNVAMYAEQFEGLNPVLVDYAIMLLDSMLDYSTEYLEDCLSLEEALLCGASSWQQYSDGGCSLVYNSDIAKTLRISMEEAIEHGLELQARQLANAREFLELISDGYC